MSTHQVDVSEVADKTFDYVVIGGGTTGLCVAARLSEDPQTKVLILEAGELRVNDPLINVPSGFPRQMGNPDYDWVFKTVPQKNVNNRSIMWSRGKSVGGSSNINYMAWTHPGKEDIDAWEKLGNPGWNYENLVPYLKKCENFHIPSDETVEREKLEYDSQWFGKEGPVSVSFGEICSGVDVTVRETLGALGVSTLKDPFNGKTSGTWCSITSVDPRTQTRSSALSAYFLPNQGRANLRLLSEASVSKIELSSSPGSVTATGVEFVHGGKTYKVKVGKEAILAAGAVKSPQILELSGVGDKKVLEPLGINVKVELPGVGRNVQDQTRIVGLVYELRDGVDISTFDVLKDPVEREKNTKLYSEERRGLLALTVSGMTYLPVQTFSKKAKEIVDSQLAKISKADSGYSPELLEQYRIQAERLASPVLHDCEIITEPMFGGFVSKPEPGKKYISFLVAMTSPWSRGTIHIGSIDPLEQPVIDPHYLEEEIDLELLAEAYTYARRIAETEPFKNYITKELEPGPSVQSDAEVKDFIKQGFNTIYHTTGSLSMLPKEKGGVVDTSLKVWGTNNIRVVDISVLPMQLGVHAQATAYALAERAADIIRGKKPRWA